MTAKPVVSLYDLRSATGRHIRIATQVTLPNGAVVRFMDRMSKRAAIAQALAIAEKEEAKTWPT